MEKTLAPIDELIRAVGTLAEQPEVQALIEVVSQQQQQIEAQQQQIEKLKDELSKLKHRSSHNSSVPPSQDLLKKPSRKDARKPGKKRGPEYDHPGSTRNGFGQAHQIVRLSQRNLSSVWQGRHSGGASTTQSAASGRAGRETDRDLGIPTTEVSMRRMWLGRIWAIAVGSQRGIQLWSETQQHCRLAGIWRQLDKRTSKFMCWSPSSKCRFLRAVWPKCIAGFRKV